MSDLSSPSPRPLFQARPLTAAGGILLLLAGLAAVIRLAGLGETPLAPAEAEAALHVWGLFHPAEITAPPTSPAYVTFSGLLAFFLGVGDATVRLAPALFSLGLALLPWLLRDRLGTAGAVVSSLLLIASPLLTLSGRTAGGDAIALFALLLLFVAGLKQGNDRRWRYGMGGALALGLTSSPLFYSGLTTLLLAWGIYRLVENKPLAPAALWAEGERQEWWRTAVFTALLFLAIGATLLFRINGLGEATTLPGAWLRRFTLSGGVSALLDPFLALGRYESILVLLSVVAIVWTLQGRRVILTDLCLYWLAGGVLLLFLQQGFLPLAPLLALPAALLVGAMAGTVLSGLRDPLTWGVGVGMAMLGAMILVHLARFARTTQLDPSNPSNWSNAWLALLMLIVAVGVAFYLWSWVKRPTLQGILLAVLALGLYFQWGTAWQLTQEAANDPRALPGETAVAADDLPLLIETIREISHRASGAPGDAPLASSVESPLLRWYLRDFTQATIGPTLPLEVNQPLVITPAESKLQAAADYLGSDFGLLHIGVQPSSDTTEPVPLAAALRRWFFHETTAGIEEKRVILWVRADVVQPNE